MTALPAKVQNMARGLGITVSRHKALARWQPARDVNEDFRLSPYKHGRQWFELLLEIETLLAIPPRPISTPARTTQDDCQ